ncbi:glycoside hydrolase family 2 protein [Olsenella sp. Marseille-P4559]|uniref:glycoside hydrolase family 2 protein n=1 Tax=Olsenella sp. Marseille-P4559 TaxID=2364795 RepID=UPI0010316B17|nr:sugar-binding domain-containing protein [Olsenella sp. Marseille-P4559]
MDIRRMLAGRIRTHEWREPFSLWTPWGEGLRTGEDEAAKTDSSGARALDGHPHPQFARESWGSLDGWWECAFAPSPGGATPECTAPVPATFPQRIRVPFSPEAPLSGVGRQLQPDELLWYRRTFDAPHLGTDERLLLHFDAVDYACACFVNGRPAGTHTGGYLPFSFDVTNLLVPGEKSELTLCVRDPSDTASQPRGKQLLQCGTIWYTAQSGIWQDVWWERVPENHIEDLLVDASPDAGDVTVCARVTWPGSGLLVSLLSADGAVLASGSAVATERSVAVRIPVAAPHLWCPGDPYLYGLRIEYGTDVVTSYCAFRTITVEKDDLGTPRFCLNHQPLFLRGLLDQGYWPDGLLTAPSADALAADIKSAKDHGFNMLRKHIKIEQDRFYWLCDCAGMLVWQDMVSGGTAPYDMWQVNQKPTASRFACGHYRDDIPSHWVRLSSADQAYQGEWVRTCEGAVRYLRNHPCIVTWVLFNEGWGQFDARDAVCRVRAIDPTRPVDATSGWFDQRCGDYLSEHNYFRRLSVRHQSASAPPRAFVISEFGGLPWYVPDHSSYEVSYGYAGYKSLEEWRTAVRALLAEADALEAKGLSGFVYTQLSDVEEETNGLLSYDRRVDKLPM